MATRIAERALTAFKQRYERDNVASMSAEQWNEWVDRLPQAEFFAMTGLKEPGPPAGSPLYDDLCKSLACIAALNLDRWPKAQQTVYEAVRILSQYKMPAKRAGDRRSRSKHGEAA